MYSLRHHSAIQLLLLTVNFGPNGFVEQSALAQPPEAWINEFHYDDVGADSIEFVEIAVTEAVDLDRLAVVLYNGSSTQLKVYATHVLSTFDIGANENGVQLYAKPIAGLQNGSDGIAICFDADDEAGFETLVSSGVTSQFLSYEGAFVPVDGCAAGHLATDVGVEETSTSPEGSSLGLEGGGMSYDDFAWKVMERSTPGAANTGQTFGPLAVRISDLHLTVEHRNVRIGWTTVSERDHVGFHVERLADPAWVDIGFVASSGVEAGSSYTFVDRNVRQLPATYRLRLTAVDGTREYSRTIVAPHIDAPLLGAAHPNPAAGVSRFLVSATHAGFYRVTLHDILGREIAELLAASFESGTTRWVYVETAGLPSGTYFYRVSADGGASTVGRLAVRR